MDRMGRVLDRLRRQAGAREGHGDGGGGAVAGGGAAHPRPEPDQLVYRRLHPRLVDLAGDQRLGRGRHERRPRRRLAGPTRSGRDHRSGRAPWRRERAQAGGAEQRGETKGDAGRCDRRGCRESGGWARCSLPHRSAESERKPGVRQS